MTGRKFLSPRLLWLAPQSDHGSAACAETEAFFQYGSPQSFFQLSWLALQKARREVGATIGSLRNPITGAPRARKLKLFSGSPYKKHAGGKLAQGLMTGRKFLSPAPLMARSAIRSRECRVRGN